ncbi:collagen alpha-1(I) chain-like [Lepisosteus oculatus]|uniref:collagen alpha-1(I) chain-like n=1 Tax=Lepisosteus oculatus TaxID=7918 RepID=UPI0035F51A5A
MRRLDGAPGSTAPIRPPESVHESARPLPEPLLVWTGRPGGLEENRHAAPAGPDGPSARPAPLQDEPHLPAGAARAPAARCEARGPQVPPDVGGSGAAERAAAAGETGSETGRASGFHHDRFPTRLSRKAAER